MPSKHLAYPDETNEFYWAFVLYVRGWLNFDGPVLGLIRAAGGQISAEHLRAIAKFYGVARGIPAAERGDGTDKSAEHICGLLNRSSEKWPNGYVARANFCADLAKQAKEAEATRNLQLSAFSKLMWFRSPENWAIFDTFAAKGLRISAASESRDRFISFYETFAAKHGPDIASLREVLQNGPWRAIQPERIIDMLLMCRGGYDDTNATIKSSQCFLDAAPDSLRQSICETACVVQERAGKNLSKQRHV